jgi:cob(I)alamin adenosyltransferase
VPQRRKGLVELTGSGDDGTTALLGGGRIRKDDVRIDAYGTVDEASSAIGVGKSLSSNAHVREVCEQVQRGLYRLGAELATRPDRAGTFATTTAADVEGLEALTADLEHEAPMPDGFVLPGVTPASAALDMARTVVRRCERRVVELAREGGVPNTEVLRYLNRLSLLLFVLARYEEHRSGVVAERARKLGSEG